MEDLYIYPGGQAYVCSRCNEVCIPRTFEAFYPICRTCVSALGLKCVSHDLSAANDDKIAGEIRTSIALARELTILEFLEYRPAKTSEIALFLEEYRKQVLLRNLYEMKSKGQLIGCQRKRLGSIWWANPGDEERLFSYALLGKETQQQEVKYAT